MVPSFRYHLLTIVAIFLALGVGMLIGSSYIQGPLADQLSCKLETLNGQFAKEVVPLRDQNKRNSDFLAVIGPILLKDHLKGKKIAIVQTGDYPDTTRKTREAYAAAGANVQSVTTIVPNFTARADIVISSVISKLRETHPSLASDRASVMRVLA